MSGVLFAILSAVIWGAGDFYGGLATRRNSQYQVLVLVSIIGAGLLFLATLVLREARPAPLDLLWAASAGIAGAIGIMALYAGLAQGNAALVSPIAAVLSAALPLIFSLLTEGLPAPHRLAGLMIAVPGIWRVTRSGETDSSTGRKGLGLALLAGASFAAFFVLIAQVKVGTIFAPLVISKLAEFGVGLIFMLRQKERIPSLNGNPEVLLAGLFDAGGNVFFLMAEQNTRLGTAAVLSSMYGAVTVILSQFILKERVTSGQWFGIGLCLLAIGLIVS